MTDTNQANTDDSEVEALVAKLMEEMGVHDRELPDSLGRLAELAESGNLSNLDSGDIRRAVEHARGREAAVAAAFSIGYKTGHQDATTRGADNA